MLFLLLYPLGEGDGPLFGQTEMPFYSGMFCAKLVEIGYGSGEEDENVKSLQTYLRKRFGKLIWVFVSGAL